MRFKKLGRILSISFVVCVVLCAFTFGILRWKIQGSLDDWCARAQATHPHPADDVAALIAYVQSDSHTLQERNSAIWALGQARDRRALSALETYYTGETCNHKTDLCQRELAKAIKLCRGETPNLLRIRTP